MNILEIIIFLGWIIWGLAGAASLFNVIKGKIKAVRNKSNFNIWRQCPIEKPKGDHARIVQLFYVASLPALTTYVGADGIVDSFRIGGFDNIMFAVLTVFAIFGWCLYVLSDTFE